MPVRSLTQSVLRWPRPEQMLQEVEAWAEAQHQRLQHWPLASLPLSCDALVLTRAELQRDLRWLPSAEDGCC
jgi:hypothetical protein